jgi:predicted transglutaminase-like cysteine proteinase
LLEVDGPNGVSGGLGEGQKVKFAGFPAIWRACLILFLVSLLPLKAHAQSRSPSAEWSLFGHEALWDGWSARELDPRRWDVLTAPIGRSDIIGARMIQSVARSMKNLPPAQQVVLINRYFNSLPYVEDTRQFGDDDHWQHAEEFVRRGGECKDYAIAKYRTLIAAGFPENRMRIVLVDDRVARGEHAVLAIRLHGQTFILDNQVKEVRAEQFVTTYRPLYAFNRNDVFFYPSDKPKRPLPDLVVSARSR